MQGKAKIQWDIRSLDENMFKSMKFVSKTCSILFSEKDWIFYDYFMYMSVQLEAVPFSYKKNVLNKNSQF